MLHPGNTPRHKSVTVNSPHRNTVLLSSLSVDSVDLIFMRKIRSAPFTNSYLKVKLNLVLT